MSRGAVWVGFSAVSGSGDEPAREQLLHITSRLAGQAIVLAVAGEVDIHTAGRLRDAISVGFAEPAAELVVLDLTEVTFLGSFGLTALVTATREARDRREPLRVVVDHNRPVIRPIQLSGLDDVLALYHSIEDALARPPAGRGGSGSPGLHD